MYISLKQLLKLIKKIHVIDMEFQAENVEFTPIGEGCVKCKVWHERDYKKYNNNYYCQHCWNEYKKEILNIKV